MLQPDELVSERERGVNTREWGNELSDWDWWDSCHDFIYTDWRSSLQPGWHLQQKWNGNLGQQQVSYLAWSDLKLLMQIYSGVFISIIHYAQNTIASVVSDIVKPRPQTLSPKNQTKSQ